MSGAESGKRGRKKWACAYGVNWAAFRPADLHLLSSPAPPYSGVVRIAKPILLVSTPLGIVTGLIEAYRMVGGLVIVMFAMMGLLGVAFAGVVATIRKEKKWMQSSS
jgi:hypothetical protein